MGPGLGCRSGEAAPAAFGRESIAATRDPVITCPRLPYLWLGQARVGEGGRDIYPMPRYRPPLCLPRPTSQLHNLKTLKAWQPQASWVLAGKLFFLRLGRRR